MALNLIDVRDFGATPYNTSFFNNTPFQNALDEVYNTEADGLYIPEGDWHRIDRIVPPWWCYIYAKHARLFSSRPTINSWQMITQFEVSGKEDYLYSDPGISPTPLVIQGPCQLISDQSYWSPADYTSFQREHVHCIALQSNNPDGNSLLDVRLNDVTCKETTGNGVYARYCRLDFNNLEGSNLFRGLLSVTDHGHVTGENFLCYGDHGGIDCESNSGGLLTIKIINLITDNDFDIATRPGSIAEFINPISYGSPLNIVNRSSVIKINGGFLKYKQSEQPSDPPFRLRGIGGISEYTGVHFLNVDEAKMNIDETGAINHKVSYNSCFLGVEPMTTASIRRQNYVSPSDNNIRVNGQLVVS